MKSKRMRIGLKITISFVVLLLLIIGGFLIYVSNYYHADNAAIMAAKSATHGVHVTKTNDTLVFNPGNADTAFVFYPGGKVEYTAYEPLMMKVAQQGILCILPKMPFNLAVFNINATDDYTATYPQIKHWFVGGHSLGGSMAAEYASNNSSKVDGLILLASYSAADLSQSGINVLSIYGSNDGVLNKASYDKNKSNLPVNFTEHVLKGGNHAGFGNYGLQKGDGKVAITPDQQQTNAAQVIAKFMLTEK